MTAAGLLAASLWTIRITFCSRIADWLLDNAKTNRKYFFAVLITMPKPCQRGDEHAESTQTGGEILIPMQKDNGAWREEAQNQVGVKYTALSWPCWLLP